MKNNRTVGIIITVLTALVCCCTAIFTAIFGGTIASGAPVTVTGTSGIPTSQTYPPAIGYALLGLSILFIIVPIAVGFFTLRNKPQSTLPGDSGPLPPAS
jgi:TRAP-type C4-dicarboxylate transport system permease small subunit